VSRADLEKQPQDVARMFDTVARRYDLTNDVLSLGQDRRWRKRVLRAVAPRRGDVILDLAAGTGTSSAPFAAAGATVVPCDFSLGMLKVGREARPDLPFVAGDGMRLPFAAATFDAVTISFGLRNIHDPKAGLAELLRVTKPGGRLVVCGSTSGQAAEISLPRLFFKQHEIIGSTMGSYEEFAEVTRLVDRGLPVIIDRTYPLADYRAALERLETGQQLGKIVLLHPEPGGEPAAPNDGATP
jgi:ubiquinone/menaquinone biosynthesis methyltransferase